MGPAVLSLPEIRHLLWTMPVPVVNPPGTQPPPWGAQVPQGEDAQPPLHQLRPEGFLPKEAAQFLGAMWSTGYPLCLGHGRPLAAGTSRVVYPGPSGWVYKVTNARESNMPDVNGYLALPTLCPVAIELGIYDFGQQRLHVIAQAMCVHTLQTAIMEGRPPAVETVYNMGKRIGSARKQGWHTGDIHASSWGLLPNGDWCLLAAGCLHKGGMTEKEDAVKSFSMGLSQFPNLTAAFVEGCLE